MAGKEGGVKRHEIIFFGISILIALAGVIACTREDDSETSNRENPPAAPEAEASHAGPESEPVPKDHDTPDEGRSDQSVRVYAVPPDFLTSMPGASGGGADPFAAPSESDGGGGVAMHRSGKEVLIGYGLSAPDLAGATFDPETNELTVTATPDQLALVDAIMESLQRSIEKLVSIRIEIFQLPAAQALQFQRSAEAKDDHAGEWQAVNAMVEQGSARFVTSLTVQSRSGNRARVEAVEERFHITEYFSAEEKANPRRFPRFEMRKIGTQLETDPVIGPDDRTLDLNVNLEFHTAPPTLKTERVRFPDVDREVEVEVAAFHVITHTSQITMLAGQVKLLAAWRPTGKPEFESADVMQVAFLKADIQPLLKIGRIR